MPRLGSTGQHSNVIRQQFRDEAGKLGSTVSCSGIAVWWVLGTGSMANKEMGGSRMLLVTLTNAVATKVDNS